MSYQRDLAIVQLVYRFHQLTSRHVRRIIFPDHKSNSPADRTLQQLVERRLLHRIERRLVGGANGGSGQYVYQVGPEGYKLFSDSRWTPARAISFHSLAIADCYAALVELERDGKLVIKGYVTEPDCHMQIGRFYLKPDLYAELERPDGSNGIRLMFEIDMGSQGPRQITEKLTRYWNASQAAEVDEWPHNQLVLFVAVDEVRAKELRWLLERGGKEQQELFRVRTLANLAEGLAG